MPAFEHITPRPLEGPVTLTRRDFYATTDEDSLQWHQGSHDQNRMQQTGQTLLKATKYVLCTASRNRPADFPRIHDRAFSKASMIITDLCGMP